MSIQLDKVQPKNKAQLKSLIDHAFKHNIYDLNFIDTSEITDMSWLFEYISCNFNISNWDVSNVKDMTGMFYCCKKFDCDLSNWNVSNVTDMHALFYECNKFTGKGLEHWDMSNVTKADHMFYKCKTFNCDLSNCDVSNVTNMEYMFSECKNFNCDLSKWNVSNVTNMDNMFDGCNKMTIPNWYK